MRFFSNFHRAEFSLHSVLLHISGSSVSRQSITGCRLAARRIHRRRSLHYSALRLCQCRRLLFASYFMYKWECRDQDWRPVRVFSETGFLILTIFSLLCTGPACIYLQVSVTLVRRVCTICGKRLGWWLVGGMMVLLHTRIQWIRFLML